MMRCIHTDGNTVELNFMWLPTWIGQNAQLKQEIERDLRNMIVGQELTEETLDSIHHLVIKYLCDKFPLIIGLKQYLEGLRYVSGVECERQS